MNSFQHQHPSNAAMYVPNNPGGIAIDQQSAGPYGRPQPQPPMPWKTILDARDQTVLRMIRMQFPNNSLASYCLYLWHMTGSNVMESTVAAFFNAGMAVHFGPTTTTQSCLPSYSTMIPSPNDKPFEFLLFMLKHQPTRVKFGDDKRIRAGKLFRRKPVPLSRAPDFDDRYNIVGFCGLSTHPFHFAIRSGAINASLFSLCVEQLIVVGGLQSDDILVVDNKYNIKWLRDFVWNLKHPVTSQPMRIVLLHLPPAACNLQPIRHLWKKLVLELEDYAPRGPLGPSVAVAVSNIMSTFTREDVVESYEACYGSL